MKKLIFTISILYSIYLNAQEFEPPVIIDPPNPMVGDTIRVGLFTTYYPPCLILPQQNQQGLSHIFEFTDNHIDFTVVALTVPICNPLPVSPAPREFYELGQLDEGTYTLQTYGVDDITPLPVPITVPPTYFPYFFGDIVTFSVVKPHPIDAVSSYSLTLIMLLFLLSTLFFLYKKEQ